MFILTQSVTFSMKQDVKNKMSASETQHCVAITLAGGQKKSCLIQAG